MFIAGICLLLFLAMPHVPAHAEESGDQTVDQLFDKAVIERLEKEANDHGHADRMIKQRVLYIAAVTLSGFISVYYEMKTIPQRRNIRKIEKNIMKLNQAKKRRMKRK